MRRARPVLLFQSAQPGQHRPLAPDKRVRRSLLIQALRRNVSPPIAARQNQPPHRRGGRVLRVRRVCVIIAGAQDGQRTHGTVLREERAAVFESQNVVGFHEQPSVLPERFQRPLPRGGVAEAGLHIRAQRLFKFRHAGSLRRAEARVPVPGFTAEAEKAAAKGGQNPHALRRKPLR